MDSEQGFYEPQVLVDLVNDAIKKTEDLDEVTFLLYVGILSRAYCIHHKRSFDAFVDLLKEHSNDFKDIYVGQVQE